MTPDLALVVAPCDWDAESFCTVDGCHAPAAHSRLDSMVGDTPLCVMLCCFHAVNREPFAGVAG